MDYQELAHQFKDRMQSLQRTSKAKHFTEKLNGEAFILWFLSDNQRDGDITPTEISNAMNISTARIAATLNGLETKGYITREIDKVDRRRILVRLTQEGQDFAQSESQKHTAILTHMLKALGEQDAKEYIRITGRIAEIFCALED